MGKDAREMTSEEIYAAPIPNIEQATAEINQMLARNPNVNAYTVRNQAIIESKKREIVYKRGRTLPMTAQALKAEAERQIDHSRKLGRNMRISGSHGARGADIDAHHIVAQSDQRARVSRRRLFGVGIGINDADNGAFMTSFAHDRIHTDKYHASVAYELITTSEYTQDAIRTVLRAIRNRLIAGTFPF